MSDRDTARRLHRAQARADGLRAELAQVTDDLSAGEERAAQVWDDLAETHPDRAAALHAQAEQARRFAARERQELRPSGERESEDP